MNVKLTNTPLSTIAENNLTPEQLEMYRVYLQTSGNKPLIFGGGSPDTSASEDLSGVDFVNGTRPGNTAIVDLAKRQVSFCDLALHEERQLYTVDKYFQDEEAEPRYQMAGKEITPKLLLEAIRTLPEEKRTAILLYYFEGMTDVEIGKMFNTSRSTIQYRRTSSFELLKKYLEGHADEWEEW